MMLATNTELAAAVEVFFADLGRVRASGGVTEGRSSYGLLANLLNAVGEALKPKVFCVGEYLARALSHREALAEPKDLARLLTSCVRDWLARNVGWHLVRVERDPGITAGAYGGGVVDLGVLTGKGPAASLRRDDGSPAVGGVAVCDGRPLETVPVIV